MMEKWEDFLKKLAVDYGLTTAERDIFLRQFCEENRGKQRAKTEEEFAAELNVELPSYKKYKTEIFKKFTKSSRNPEGYEFGRGAGKLAKLEIFLIEKYEDWITGKSNISPPREVLECPYKGLFAFKTEDARFFFGRERFTSKLIKLIQSQPFLAVIGNSGIGKSSIVYAGVIPALTQLGGWKFIAFRPNDNPFAQLANAVLSLLEPKMDKLERLTKAKKYVSNFKIGGLTLKDILDDSLSEKPNQQFLIFVDQFEEIWTLTPTEERDIFINQLLEVVKAEKKKEKRLPNVVVVITFRIDFYGQIISYQPLGEILQEWKPETVLPMNREELQEVIEKPAAAVGLTIQEGLIKIILDEIQNNPGELPLLEFALEKLWEKHNNGQLTIAAYNEIEGVEKALANHADEIYQKLNADEQNRVKYIFTQLVRFGESTEATRRLATHDEIGAENWKLVTKLAGSERELEARLVTTGYDESKQQRTVEVVHEALIRGWDHLQEWMEEDREFRKWQDRLRAEKDIWKNSSEDHGALLRGALLVQAEDWLEKRNKSITNQEEREFILASRLLQEQEDIARIQDLLILSQKELELKQQLSAVVIAVKAGVKLRNIRQPSDKVKRNIVEKLEQGIYEISEYNQLIGHTSGVTSVSFSRDGSMIVSSSDDHTIKLWDLYGRLLMNFEGHTDQVYEVSFSPDSQIIASASVDKSVKLWSVNGILLKTLEGHTDQVYGVSFSPNGKMIASAGSDKTVRIWDINGKLLKTLEGHEGRIYGVRFSPDGQTIASASADKTIRLWSIEGKILTVIEGHSDGVRRVNFSPNSQIIASTSNDKSIKLWNLDGVLLRTLKGHHERVYEANFSPDGQTIVSASNDKTVKLWNLEGTLLRTLEGHTDGAWGVNFSPDGQIVASASLDRTVRLWNLNGNVPIILEGHTNWVYSASFSPDGQTIASASLDRTVRLWNLNGTSIKTLEGHTADVQKVSFSPNGQIIASASSDKTVRLWNLNRTIPIILEGHTDQVYGVSFSPDGQIVASASLDKTIKLWNLDGMLLKTIKGHSAQVYGVTFSPDGQTIASASVDRTIKLWSFDGTLLKTLKGHNDWVYGVTFSPDGQTIASASVDRTIKLWSLDGTLLKTLKGHNDWVYGVTFSPDGEMIASASVDRTIKLWNLDGIILRTLKGHSDQIHGVSFSPDGRIIVSASLDKTLRLWNIDSEDLILDLDIKLNNLVKKGCNWIRDYLKTNPNVSKSDRHLCDDICGEGIRPLAEIEKKK